MKTKFVSFLLVLTFVLAACSPAVSTQAPATSAPTAAATEAPTEVAGAAIPEIFINAADFSYKAPSTIGAGWVRETLANSGSEPHHVQFLRLNDGVTVQQFEDALKQAEGPALALTKQVGGVGAIAPGLSAQAVMYLPAGQYVILCLIPSPGDHVAHHDKGMIQSLTVEDRNNQAAAPAAGLTVHLKDFAFDMPDTLPGGPLTIEVVNDGPEPHEFNIMKLQDGKTAADVMAFLNGEAGGPPPFVPVGGMNGLDSGSTGYAELHLLPGTYVAICNIPSPKAEGHPHFALGMIKQFTVGDGTSAAFPFGTFAKTSDAEYTYIFHVNGYWEQVRGGTKTQTGTFSVDGNVFTETSNSEHCQTNVSFTYTFDGTNLTFQYVGDPKADLCIDRSLDFNNVTYTLVK